MRKLQYNPEIIKSFIKLCRPFLTWRGVFVPEKYQHFLLRGSEKQITTFYNEAQQFIVNLIGHIYSVEKGENQWSRYFIDLTMLLASGMDTSIRTHSIDNARATVDIKSFKLDEIIEEISCIAKEPFEKNPKLRFLIAPSDFTLCYNVGDFFIVGLDLRNRKLIHPKIIELKTRKADPKNYNPVLYKKQLERQKRQAERILKTHVARDIDLENKEHKKIYTFPTYLQGKQKEVLKLLKPTGELPIDDVFSLVISKKWLTSTNAHFVVNLFEEIVCGNIIPSIFKGVDIRLFEKLMTEGLFLSIKADKNKLCDHLKSIPTVKKVEIDQSPYRGYVYFTWGRISLANLIHLKYPIKQLENILARNITVNLPKENRYYHFGPQ